jgi:NAD(P)-dependent dehydrogenase (short-subunit alcohol dehydrogenase family)
MKIESCTVAVTGGAREIAAGVAEAAARGARVATGRRMLGADPATRATSQERNAPTHTRES